MAITRISIASDLRAAAAGVASAAVLYRCPCGAAGYLVADRGGSRLEAFEAFTGCGDCSSCGYEENNLCVTASAEGCPDFIHLVNGWNDADNALEALGISPIWL